MLQKQRCVVLLCGIHHRLCGNLYLKRIRQQVEDEAHVDVTEVDEVFDFLFVDEVYVVDHLIAEEPGIVELVAGDLEGKEVGFAPVSLAGHVQVKVVQLVKEQGFVVEALLGKAVVDEAVALVEGLDVIIDCGLAVVHLIVDALSELEHSWLLRFFGLGRRNHEGSLLFLTRLTCGVIRGHAEGWHLISRHRFPVSRVGHELAELILRWLEGPCKLLDLGTCEGHEGKQACEYS